MKLCYQIRWRKDAKSRYYNVYLYKDLFDDWVITQVWGSTRTKLGNYQHHVFFDKENAMNFIDEIKATRQQHGYQRVN